MRVPSPLPETPSSRVAHARVLEQLRAKQRQVYGLTGAALVLLVTLSLGVTALMLAPVSAGLGRALLALAFPLGAAVGVGLGLYWSFKHVGDSRRTARLLAERIPELKLDVLAAVELAQELRGETDPHFSADLARAAITQADEQLSKVDLRRAVDRTGLKRVVFAGAGVMVLLLAIAVVFGDRLALGVALTFATDEKPEQLVRREPITGDVTLTYRYPAYTGLEPRTVEGTTGEISAPAGTEVQLQTRADRDVKAAALVVNGQRLNLALQGPRQLDARFILDKPGQWHALFLDNDTVLAQGPDVPIRIEPDLAPEVRLTAPAEALELDEKNQKVPVKYESSDDFGLSELSLVFRAGERPEERLKLSLDEGRRASGTYNWDVTPLKLKPGQTVRYYLEVKDNDAVAGAKKGVSKTQTLKLYSAQEHRRAAVEKASQLWERLVLHLADRMESFDRTPLKAPQGKIDANAELDNRGTVLAADSTALARELAKEPDAPDELVNALVNVGGQLKVNVLQTGAARRMYSRLRGEGPDFSQRLASAAQAEVASTEKSVLYLEQLIDRQKANELKALAELLRADRRDLSQLLEEFKKSKDDQTQQRLLEQMQQIREHMQELMKRMSELSKGIRDEHVNREAIDEMMKEEDLGATLDEVERLVKEGKSDEALKKMQELAMQMDQMLENLEDAAEQSDMEADPELAEKFQKLQEDLEKTVREQAQVAEETKEIKDRYKDEVKKRVAERGAKLKAELLEKTKQIRADYEKLDGEKLGSRFERPRAAALMALDNLEQSLQADDFDLALDAANQLQPYADDIRWNAEDMQRNDERFKNPPEVLKESRELAQRLKRDAQRAEEVQKKLQEMFPDPSQQLSQGDQAKARQLGKRQQQLEQQAGQLQEQMEEMPQIFNPDSQRQMEQAQQQMSQAKGSLERRNVRKGHGEQSAALESLRGLQKQMQQAQQQRGKGKGLPMPLGSGRRGFKEDKVEIPDEDPNGESRDMRKDVLEMMKQGQPDKYRDQNKHYYEELVK